LAIDPIQAEGFALQVERFYAALISNVDWVPQVSLLRPGISADVCAPALPSETRKSEPSLGGKLLYAGELDEEARALLVAANIAGAASLAASADAAACKQFMRDGVVDFLVTSLDEALRILKNEIRKREPVAVCVALEPDTVEQEMLERGVAPDLARPDAADSREGQTLLCWRVASSPSIWLPKLDAIALDCLEDNLGAPEPALSVPKGLDSETWDSARRWLRLAPRYLGRMAQGIRVLRCNESSAAIFLERVCQEMERGEIGVRVELRRSREGRSEQYSFAPPTC
jgi:response regulator of citrate/malate metabolism